MPLRLARLSHAARIPTARAPRLAQIPNTPKPSPENLNKKLNQKLTKNSMHVSSIRTKRQIMLSPQWRGAPKVMPAGKTRPKSAAKHSSGMASPPSWHPWTAPAKTSTPAWRDAPRPPCPVIIIFSTPECSESRSLRPLRNVHYRLLDTTAHQTPTPRLTPDGGIS